MYTIAVLYIPLALKLIGYQIKNKVLINWYQVQVISSACDIKHSFNNKFESNIKFNSKIDKKVQVKFEG